jgi:nucleoside-diphosphate-sugar epimerase
MRVMVTGASGFLGGVVCRELGARGHEVMALVRRPGSEPAGTTPVQGDLSDGVVLARALRESKPDAVIHLAAEIASQRRVRKIENVNVLGTRRLLDACREDGGPRFVFASTVVTGEAGGAVLTEETELPVQTPYGESKQAGEQLVRESGLDHVIIRPGHIYGPGGWYEEEFVKRLRQPGRFAVIGRGGNWWDVVRVEDVARLFADATERAPSGALYHVADDTPVRFYDFVARTAEAMGVGAPRRIPAWVARLAAGRHAVTAVTRSARTSNEKAKAELGWAPAFPSYEQGVPDAVAALTAA